MSEKTEKLLEKSIKNLRENLSEDISMDVFVKSTIRPLRKVTIPTQNYESQLLN